MHLAAARHGEEPYTYEQADEQIRRAMLDGESVFEWRCRQRDGELFWAEIAMRRFELGDHPHVMASIRDIDGRKRMEAALQASEQLCETPVHPRAKTAAYQSRISFAPA